MRCEHGNVATTRNISKNWRSVTRQRRSRRFCTIAVELPTWTSPAGSLPTYHFESLAAEDSRSIRPEHADTGRKQLLHGLMCARIDQSHARACMEKQSNRNNAGRCNHNEILGSIRHRKKRSKSNATRKESFRNNHHAHMHAAATCITQALAMLRHT